MKTLFFACGASGAIAAGSGCGAVAPTALDVAPSSTQAERGGTMVACDGLVTDKSGLGLSAAQIAAFGDPVAALVLRDGSSCPLAFGALSAKLAAGDTAGCSGDAASDVQTAVVSERGQLRGVPDDFSRVIVSRRCEQRAAYKLFFAMKGLVPASSAADVRASDLEAIAYDDTEQLFRFYSMEDLGQGRRWFYFGSSKDLLRGTGDGQFPNQVRRCAACHASGGPLMKEIELPWFHWDTTDLPVPGSSDFVARAKDVLGTKIGGIEMEALVQVGLLDWNRTRVADRKANASVAELLRPLFCTVDANVASSADPPSRVSSVPSTLFGDPRLVPQMDVPVTSASYLSALDAAGQRVVDAAGKTVLDASGHPIVDLTFAFAYPDRAFSDDQYVDELQTAGIVDDDFTLDVLAVDFVRPVFSDARCGLLSFAPELAAGGRTPDAIRDGFRRNLAATAHPAGSPAAVLLQSLATVGDQSAHKAAVDAFVTACRDRARSEPAAFLADALKVVSLRRAEGRKRALFEFPEGLPVDALEVPPKTFLDPVTCRLRETE
jgi:hypothetical protein